MKKIKQTYDNSLVLNHDLVGGKWKLRILWHIIHGENRFSMLERAIPDITQKVLSCQLKELSDSGILKKEVVDDVPPKTIIYHIASEYGMLPSIIDSIYHFTNSYAKNNNIEVGNAAIHTYKKVSYCEER